ncbi:iron ABC transporter permease [Sinomonas halotolerans]|uniref:Iron ABC transporter permease n=1 Tax=Sinomonas halotolerans TaxID=1644133 RepID=A0ABU9X3J3_9MICC
MSAPARTAAAGGTTAAEGTAAGGTTAQGARPASRATGAGPFARLGGTRPVRVGAVSVLVRPRAVWVGAAALAVLAAAVLGHLSLGGRPLAPDQVLAALAGDPAVPARVQLMVVEFRLPRTLAGIVAGACLAVAGAITQTVARNPLATPEILGVTSGASVGAVGILVLAGAGHGGASGVAESVGMPVAAAAGALGVGCAVFLLAYRRAQQSLDSMRLVLVGLGAAGLATSLTTWLLTLGDVSNASQALTWMMGSLNGKDFSATLPALAAAVPLMVLAAACGRWLVLSSFDDDTARGLGLPLGRSRPLLLLLAVLLAAVGTVLAGPVAFVALVCPLAARSVARAVVPPLGLTAVVGAAFTVACDLLAGFALPQSLPVGVVTTVLGAPVLIALVARSQRRSA